MVKVVSLCIAVAASGAGPIVGPGGVVPFGGSNAPGQRVSYGRITESQVGFFVSGSSIYAMNGMYIRGTGFPKGSRHRPLNYRDGLLCYENKITGWHMGIVDFNKPEERKEKQENWWIIVDSSGKDRFIHEGKTLLPGAGLKWSHVEGENGEHTVKHENDVHRETGQFKDSQGKAAAGQVSVWTPSLDELPWQIVGMGAPDRLQNIMQGQYYYHRLREKALRVSPLESVHGTIGKPGLGSSPPQEFSFFSQAAELSRCAAETTDSPLPAKLHEMCSKHETRSEVGFKDKIAEVAKLKLKADLLSCEGDFEGANNIYVYMLEMLAGVPHDKWIFAQVQLQKARNLRWGRSFEEARKELVQVLEIFPTYTAAVVEQGLNYLDAGEPQLARRTLEEALALDRTFDNLDYLLILARTFASRMELAQQRGKVAGLLAGSVAEVVQPDARGYQQYRFEYETRDPKCTIVHLAELTLLGQGHALKPSDVINSDGACPSQEGPLNVADGNATTKWLDLKKKPLEFAFGQRVVADGFSFTTANDGPERDPTTFRLFGSPGKSSTGWDLLVAQEKYPTTTDRFTQVGPFMFKEPMARGDEPAAEKKAEKKATGYDVRNAMRDRPNFYALLEMPVDFVFDDHLKRQFRKFSRAAHPDKNGGSNEVFQEIGKAVETLEDLRARIQYDTGFDLDSAETQASGYQAPESIKMKLEREYFPERFGFFAFQDPYRYKRHVVGAGGNRAHGNVHDEIWDKPLPETRKQAVPEMVVNEEL